MALIVTQIVLLFVLAILLGALGMRYWIYRSFEDVTEAYDVLERVKSDDRQMGKPLSLIQDRLEAYQQTTEAQLTSIGQQLTQLRQPTQWAALEAKLNELTVSDLDLSSLHKRLDQIEAQLRTPPQESPTRREPALRLTSERPLYGAPPVVSAQEPEEDLGEDEAESTRDFTLAKRADGGRNLLKEPAFGPPDALRKLSGVGPVLERNLHQAGVFYFWQIADWKDEDIAYLDAKLTSFKRIRHDELVSQASELAEEPGASERPLIE